MNQRPTRAPAPPVDDATFTEVEEHQTPAAEAVMHSPPAVRAQQSNSLPSEGPVQHPDLPITPFGKLAAAIAGVMAEIKPVEKSGWNDFHKYQYAKMGDLSIELTPLMGKHGIVVFQNEVDRAMFDEGKVISVRYQFTIVHSSGEIWPERPLITGMSRCRDSKGGFDDKAFNKAHTAARKYFLLSLFQIPTDDEHPDADTDGGKGNKRPTSRRAPNPDGKVAPQLIPIVSGEHPTSWADRFIKAIEKATGPECDLWYDENFAIFEKVKAHDETIYNRLIAAMDDRAAGQPVKQEGFAADPISSGPITKSKAPAPKDDSFPGDKPMPSFDEKLWLESLENIYSSCEDAEQLMEAQGKYMTPNKELVSTQGWTKAVGITKIALKRIEGSGR